MDNFEEFKVTYKNLVAMGICEEMCDKGIFLLYVEAEMDYPNIKKYWDEQKVYRWISGVDDKPENTTVN